MANETSEKSDQIAKNAAGKRVAATAPNSQSAKKEEGEASPSQLIDARIKELGDGGARRSPASEVSSERPIPRWSRR